MGRITNVFEKDDEGEITIWLEGVDEVSEDEDLGVDLRRSELYEVGT